MTFVPGIYYGAEGEAPRLTTKRIERIESKTLVDDYGCASMDDLCSRFNRGHAFYPAGTEPNRNLRNLRTRSRRQYPAHIPITDPLPLIPLNLEWIRWTKRTRRTGPDIDADDNGNNHEQSVECTVSAIITNFAREIIELSPNPKDAREAPYILIGPEERKKVSEHLMRSTDFSKVWRKVQYRIGSIDEWGKNFDILFPSCDAPLLMRNSSQNFAKTTYYSAWRAALSRLDERDAHSVRKAVKDFIDHHWKWLPLAQANRIWYTKLQANLVFLGGPDEVKGPCPQLMLNPLLVQSIASLRCGAHPTRNQQLQQTAHYGISELEGHDVWPVPRPPPGGTWQQEEEEESEPDS